MSGVDVHQLVMSPTCLYTDTLLLLLMMMMMMLMIAIYRFVVLLNLLTQYLVLHLLIHVLTTQCSQYIGSVKS